MKSMLIKPLINHFYKPLFPVEAIIYLTNKCNLKCDICNIGLENQQDTSTIYKELSCNDIDNILHSLQTMKVKKILVTGGEPFIANNIWYLLEQCAKSDIIVSGITTNGSMLNQLTGNQVNVLNNSKIQKIIISLDYSDKKRHDSFRKKKGLFDSIVNFLNTEKSKTINTNYYLSTVITNKNYNDLSNLINLAAKYRRIKHINFQPICITNIFIDYKADCNVKKNYNINKDSIAGLNRYINKAIKTAEINKISTNLIFIQKWISHYFNCMESNVFFPKKILKSYICSKPYNYIYINYNGDLLVCTHIGPIGNINNVNIYETWKEKSLFYKMLFKKGKYFKKCNHCYCDFSSNFFYSIIYNPITNFNHLTNLFPYYFNRYFNKL